MNVPSDDVRNIWIGGYSYRGDNSFTKFYTRDSEQRRSKTIVGGI